MLTITEIQEQIELLQRKKEEILSYTIKDTVNEKFKSSFQAKISPKISRTLARSRWPVGPRPSSQTS